MLGSFGGFDDAYVGEMQKEVKRLEAENARLRAELARERQRAEGAIADLDATQACAVCVNGCDWGETCRGFEWRGVTPATSTQKENK